MAQSYADWLKQQYGAGNRQSTAAKAAAWRRVEGVDQRGPTTGTLDPTRPTFTPGALDERGALDRADSRFSAATNAQEAEQSYTEQMAEVNAQRPQIDKQRDEGYQGADNSAAGRGMYRGGGRILDRTKVGEQADEAHRSLSRVATNAATRRQQALDRISAEQQLAEQRAMIDANERQKSTWEQQNPVTVTQPQSKAPTKSYAAFLNGRTSTAALARAWDRQHNYNQRFG